MTTTQNSFGRCTTEKVERKKTNKCAPNFIVIHRVCFPFSGHWSLGINLLRKCGMILIKLDSAVTPVITSIRSNARAALDHNHHHHTPSPSPSRSPSPLPSSCQRIQKFHLFWNLNWWTASKCNQKSYFYWNKTFKAMPTTKSDAGVFLPACFFW